MAKGFFFKNIFLKFGNLPKVCTFYISTSSSDQDLLNNVRWHMCHVSTSCTPGFAGMIRITHFAAGSSRFFQNIPGSSLYLEVSQMDRCCGCNFVGHHHDETIRQLQLFQNLLGNFIFKIKKIFPIIFYKNILIFWPYVKFIVTGIVKQHKAQVVFFDFYFYFFNSQVPYLFYCLSQCNFKEGN